MLNVGPTEQRGRMAESSLINLQAGAPPHRRTARRFCFPTIPFIKKRNFFGYVAKTGRFPPAKRARLVACPKIAQNGRNKGGGSGKPLSENFSPTRTAPIAP